MYCGSASIVKHDGNVHTARTLKCRSWGCPDCKPARTKRLIAEANAGSPCTFLTLTTRWKEGKHPIEEARKLVRAWRLVRLRWMRLQGLKKLPFILVVEKHKNGMPHLHILLRAPFIKWEILSGWMEELHDSPRIKIEAIRTRRGAAHYCSKYCSKDLQQFGKQKRYFQSRDYDLRTKHPGQKPTDPSIYYARWDRPVWMIRDFWHELGWTILRSSANETIAVSDGGTGPPS